MWWPIISKETLNFRWRKKLTECKLINLISFHYRLITKPLTFPFIATGLSTMACMPRMADWGGLIMGVPIMEPNTPPLEMVNVPPSMSSIASSFARAWRQKIKGCSYVLLIRTSSLLKNSMSEPLIFGNGMNCFSNDGFVILKRIVKALAC